MLQALRLDSKFSEEFVTSLLVRSLNLEEDLCDQLFSDSERRLAWQPVEEVPIWR